MKKDTKSARVSTGQATSPEKQLASFIAKFDPKVAKLIRACRAEMRKLFPTAVELVYDNYNFFVIGYGPSERASAEISRCPKAHAGGSGASQDSDCRQRRGIFGDQIDLGQTATAAQALTRATW